jgi:hemerythrin-like domain-containing protein
MLATDILMEEHRIIHRMVSALTAQALRLKDGTPVRAGFFLEAADFMRNYADGCHHPKEEEGLFQSMMDAGLSNQTGPIAILLADHEHARRYTRALEKSARELENGKTDAQGEVVANALAYAALLRQHMDRENDFFFPLAVRMIPPDQQEKLSIEFDRIQLEETGAGVHAKYRALVEAMEREAAG